MDDHVIDIEPCLILVLQITRRGNYDRNSVHCQQARFLQMRAKAGLRRLGRETPLGTLVLLSKLAEVQTYQKEWRAKIAEFNSSNQRISLHFDLMVFRIAGQQATQE